ncbi:hypothetical protein ACR6C2_07630 [Streptomyces sp. INA 01156]
MVVHKVEDQRQDAAGEVLTAARGLLSAVPQGGEDRALQQASGVPGHVGVEAYDLVEPVAGVLAQAGAGRRW